MQRANASGSVIKDLIVASSCIRDSCIGIWLGNKKGRKITTTGSSGLPHKPIVLRNETVVQLSFALQKLAVSYNA